MNQIEVPRYTAAPIESMAALSRALGVTSAHLLAVAARASSLYRVAEKVEKADGTFRETFDAKPALKDIHRRIKSSILDRVAFPRYLTGSIKGQDYRTNALLHRNSKILISEDIQGFFPSTGQCLVYEVWSQFFGFSDDVSRCLTSLCVKDGVLPQGGITSAHLANLVFWRVEPAVRAELARFGIRYSRYVDDICLSSPDAIGHEDKKKVIALVYAMLARHGYSAKRAKHKVQTSRGRIIATKLGVNRDPSLSQQQRGQIRAAVHKLELLFADGDLLGVRGLLPSIGGRVSMLSRFHAIEGGALAKRVALVREQLNLLPVPSATSAITSPTTPAEFSNTVPW
ncbi:reverse transcriptase family protein [Burkholderia multivorans]|uniref:reverse transcriptase family protein n=1 Tax=Burkholderia multivorans TaxID=87883 RepID=UPI001592238B|nr:reverse transcriptase family protein [Burkholderia multivorans]MBJ9658708.1 RNA-directed DNA polymerase [Burkholderia multivorans]MBR7922064.1 RNA-directed DNA polymerase [Burkholderia multivorans]